MSHVPMRRDKSQIHIATPQIHIATAQMCHTYPCARITTGNMETWKHTPRTESFQINESVNCSCHINKSVMSHTWMSKWVTSHVPVHPSRGCTDVHVQSACTHILLADVFGAVHWVLCASSCAEVLYNKKCVWACMFVRYVCLHVRANICERAFMCK